MAERDQILMCRPSHFGVSYVINPWMEGHVGRADRDVALEQWTRLADTLGQRADLQIMDGVPGLPDMCFTANAGLVWGDRFVPTTFRVAQREPEMSHFIDWFSQAGYQIAPLPDAPSCEGEGDLLYQLDQQGGCLWAGYGVRSSLESHRAIGQRLGVEVVSLRLVDQRFYHLDTCFVALPGGRVMYYPAAFDERSLREIRHRVPPAARLEVDKQDAMRFACNALVLGETLVTNFVSDPLRRRLAKWALEVIVSPVDEFLLAGGGVKCLSLFVRRPVPHDTRPQAGSSICSTHVLLAGHLLDSGLMNRLFDVVGEAGGEATVEQLDIGQRRDQPSTARVRITAPSAERLELVANQLMPLGARRAEEDVDARLEPVCRAGVAPCDFYSTTIYPTRVRVGGKWVRATHQRMDAVIRVTRANGGVSASCCLIRDLQVDDQVVCGVAGVRIDRPLVQRREGEFAFMSAGVSSERRVELAVDQLAWEIKRIRARGGKVVFVAGPVVIHTGGGEYLSEIIRHGYIQALLTGNALPAHDLEFNLFGTSLGVDLAHGVGVHGGHQHHIKAINRVREAGSIRAAVEQGIITNGVMYECVRNNVQYVLAGSIRDDGPLPDTLMDLVAAQAAYAAAIDGADMIVMLSSMLHSIGTGNMTPAGVRLVCVDISPEVVTKLADRGSVESTGIVTDVGLFLKLLAQRLRE